MRSTLRTSTALIAGLSIVMGHVPVAALAQEFDASQCEAGEDEDTCLARLLEEAEAAEAPAAEAEAETAETDAEADAAEEAARLAAEEEATTEAAEAAAAEEAARLEAEAAAAEEAARLAAEETERQAAEAAAAEEAARLAAEEEAARQAAEAAAAEDAAAAEVAEPPAAEAPAPEAEAATESPAPSEEAPAEGDAAEAGEVEAPVTPAAEAETPEAAVAETVTTDAAEADSAEATEAETAVEAPLADESAVGTEPAADVETGAAASGEPSAAEAADAAEPAPVADGATDPATDEDALAAALAEAEAEGEAADTLIVAPEEITAEDEATLEAALLAAEAAELAAAAPVDPVAEAEAEVAAAEAEAAEAQQSLALAPDAEPVVGAVEEVITEETARQSDEDFGSLLTATTETDDDRDRTGLTGTQGLILGGLGGLAIGTIIAGNRQVVNRADDRLVVLRPQGDYQVIRDDDSLLRRPGNRVFTESFADGSSRNVITEPDGTQVITVRDRDLRILRRTVVAPDGTRTVLIDDMAVQRPVVVSDLPSAPSTASFVAGTSADAEALARALQGQAAVDRGFSLAQIRSIRAVRDLAPAVNLETVTFETGSAAITSDQASQLLALGRYMSDAIARNPREVFLIEGHTDATGAASFNLGLSDRRAETVALALTEYFGVRPQNMVIQGYGEEFLLIPTLENERLNRRVAVRQITDLLRVAASE